VSANAPVVLAADIGATTSRLGLYSPARGARDPLVWREFTTAHQDSLEALIRGFLDDAAVGIGSAVIAVAGPVRDGRVETDSLPWAIDIEALHGRLGLTRLRVLNDAQAMAAAVPVLGPSDIVALRAGNADAKGPIAVIAWGTGLGEAFLIPAEAGHIACASEGGHASFAPSTAMELALLQALLERFPHVSTEMVCSGSAVPDVYAHVRDARGGIEPEWLAAALAATDDPTRVIVEAALDDRDGAEACQAALALLVSILAAEAGNLVLRVNATGGLYLGGGLTSRVLPLLRTRPFLERLAAKGRDTEFLRDLPVHVITNTEAGLIGAALTGLQDL
jgi:glucokinase